MKRFRNKVRFLYKYRLDKPAISIVHSSRKYSHIPHTQSLEIPRGRGVEEEKYGAKFEFLEGLRQTKMNIRGVGYRYFLEPQSLVLVT